MNENPNSRVPKLLKSHESALLSAWIRELFKPGALRSDLIKESEAQEQCKELLRYIVQATQTGSITSTAGTEWTPARELLASISRTRAKQGFSPTEVAVFVLSLQKPVYELIASEAQTVPDALADTAIITDIINSLALLTTEVFQKSREEVIIRQQEDMLELSTPVVKLWDGVLALPIIGTLDSSRTQVVMETLLQAIVDTRAEVAIIDITGVPTVDTLVSQHLLKTVAAARLMGADCIISGIRPQIAQTIVHLGVDLTDVSTKATLADAFTLALKKLGVSLGGKSPRQQ